MSNFNLANSGAFCETPTECFISDIEQAVGDGNKFYFQKVGNKLQVIRVDDNPEIVYTLDAVPISDQKPSDETYKCYWNKGKAIIPDGKYSWLHYEWKASNPTEIVLIWWDHDLGDVVLDTIEVKKDGKTNAGGVPTELDDYDVICDNVHFYWIT